MRSEGNEEPGRPGPKPFEQKEPITRAWAAYSNPDFYRQIGKDPEQLISIGLAAIKTRFKIV